VDNLDLFADKERWPRAPYCSDDKTARSIRSLLHAIKQPYIQANPPHLRVWSIFDIDREGGALAWEDAGLPPPAWSACNTENGHAHLVWGLTAPVLVASPEMRQKPMRYLCAVEAAFRAKLEADSGFGGLMTKNPSSPLWRVLRGPKMTYELGELAEYVDLSKFLPKRKPEEVGVGRNVSLFDQLRQYAYKNIRGYKCAQQSAFIWWQKEIYGKALTYNGEFAKPLDAREVHHVAKSISKWTWNKFDVSESDIRFSKLQAHRGKKGGVASGVARASANEDKRSSARLMASQGHTGRAIAEALEVNQSTIVRWLSDARSHNQITATCGTSSPGDDLIASSPRAQRARSSSR
jgi:transposase-like protein